MKDDPQVRHHPPVPNHVGKTVRLPPSVWAKIDEYRFTKRINKQNDAIRRLIERGLETETDK